MPDMYINGFERHQQIHPGAENHIENQPSPSNGYQIRVKDHLDPCWAEWFDGWELTNLENDEFLLCRTRVDQSALHGVLNKIRDLNLTLVSVTGIAENDDPI